MSEAHGRQTQPPVRHLIYHVLHVSGGGGGGWGGAIWFDMQRRSCDKDGLKTAERINAIFWGEKCHSKIVE